MKKNADRQFVPFRDLPIRQGLPPRSSWHYFGEDDEVGTINLLTAERTASAARLVRHGDVYALNWALELPEPPIFGRERMSHSLIRLEGGYDESYDNFNPQASSQWDALCHVEHPEYGLYNGHTADEITGKKGSPLGIDNWAERGITGRYVLADIERFRRRSGTPLQFGTKDVISVQDMVDCLADQKTELSPGTILLLNLGWIDWYETLDTSQRIELAREEQFPSPGLSASYGMSEWLWDNQVAAVVTDGPTPEATPIDKASDATFLHFQLVALLGMALGEMHDLRKLVAACAADGVYDGLFVSAPINKAGGVGSPANALALR